MARRRRSDTSGTISEVHLNPIQPTPEPHVSSSASSTPSQGQHTQPFSESPATAAGATASPFAAQTPVPGYQQLPYMRRSAPSSRRNLLIIAGAAVLIVAILALVVFRGDGGESLAGTWVGQETTTDVSSNTTTQWAAEFVLTESGGGHVTGTEEDCNSGVRLKPVKVTGSRSGSSVTISILKATLSGHISGGKLTLEGTYNGVTDTMTLHSGTAGEYQSLCNGLLNPTS